MHRLLIASAVLASVACGGDMERASEITKLRVLAIQAEPPEIADGESSSLSVLVAGAEGEVTVSWDLCLIPGPLSVPELSCLEEEVIGARFGATLITGEGETATVTLPTLDSILPTAEAGAEAAGDGAGALDPEEGFGIRVLLEARDTREGASCTGDAQAREGCVNAAKAIQIRRTDTPNQNPEVTGVEVRAGDASPFDDPMLEAPYQVTAGDDLQLLPLWDGASEEAFFNRQRQVDDVEAITFSWYATSGEFDKERSSSDLEPENLWTAPDLEEDEETRAVTFWLVARDGRGGIDWTSWDALVTP